MPLRYVFTEMGIGLRRNLSMHVAVILTLFVSLTLVGMGVLLNQEAKKVSEQWGSQLTVTVYLCSRHDGNPACTSQATGAQKQAIQQVIDSNSQVDSTEFISQQQAFTTLQQQFPGKYDGPSSPITAADMPESIRITLKDPNQFRDVESAVVGLDGVSRVQDVHKLLGPIYNTISRLKWGGWGTAIVLVIAALLLVANTIRLAAFARRREIGIMRLVGASTLYIALPFLLEALVTAVVGVALAAGALWGFMELVVRKQLSKDLTFITWVDSHDYLWALTWIAILGPVLTLIPTLVLTRKYLKV
ncbi:MAG TPA: permease-like cell division protein FtsX [Nocardioides sp.]|jgi:cell division transport system permease protein|uniref:permease-like cell division protein FtsX n=1 Tax=Nocardioides sp. TaxID=35761 RepID=UPI002E31D8B9|nr:permease-like cell division protein FtsX [Nocardioides sp.]HEX3930409.1 permease-like cell division protein FtsX [Nocardioides sp.]